MYALILTTLKYEENIELLKHSFFQNYQTVSILKCFPKNNAQEIVKQYFMNTYL